MAGLRTTTLAKVFSEMSILFDKSVSEEKMEILWNAFKGWEERDFEKAAEKIKKTSKFMPTIADFYETIDDGGSWGKRAF